MPAIRVVDAAEQPFRTMRELLAGRPIDADDPRYAELDIEVMSHHPGTDGGLQYFEIRLPPDGLIPQHGHAADEIVVVLEGSLMMGRRRLGPGSSVYISGDTLYALRAGPDGLVFGNFRGTFDSTYYSKDEVMARRGGRADEEE